MGTSEVKTHEGIAFLIGLLSGILGIGGLLHSHMVDWHHDLVFEEQVAAHACKIVTVYVNGVEKQGDTCVLPNGTILRRR